MITELRILRKTKKVPRVIEQDGLPPIDIVTEEVVDVLQYRGAYPSEWKDVPVVEE